MVHESTRGCFVSGWWLSSSLTQPNTHEGCILYSPRIIQDVFDILHDRALTMYNGGFGFTVCTYTETEEAVLLGCEQTAEVVDALMHSHGILAVGFDTVVTFSRDGQGGSTSIEEERRLVVFRYLLGGMTQCRFSPINTDIRIAKIAAGIKYTVFLTEDGRVYQLINDDRMQHGAEESKHQPGLVGNLCGPIMSIACGADHCAAINHLGNLYTWGSNLRGQCGRGFSGHDVLDPGIVQALHPVKVVSVACGLSFTLCCTSLGDVYTWGTSQDGALGHQEVTMLYTPTLIECFGEDDSMMAKQVCAGSSHALVRTDSGVVFGFGSNQFGQLGLGKNIVKTNAPHQVRCSQKEHQCIDICAGWWHSIFTIKYM